MSTAKRDLIDRIRTLNSTIRDVEALRSKSLTDVVHNEMARMLRNGLAVVGFAALEDFIKKRASEAMNEISNCATPFSRLPEKLQNATTYEAISALSFQLSLHDKSAKISYIQDQAKKIASTSGSNYELTSHAFGYDQSNVNNETIKKILLCFQVDDPWRQMTLISSRIGLTGLPLDESYKNASTRRHKAAHVANSDTPEVDLIQYVKEAFGIAMSFDFLLSHAVNLIRTSDLNYLNGTNRITSNSISLRFVKYQDSNWKELLEGQSRAIRSSVNLIQIQSDAKNRAARNRNSYIEFDENGVISDWHKF